MAENCTPRVLIAGPGYTGYSRATPGFGSVEHFFAIAGATDGYGAYEELIAHGAATAIEFGPAGLLTAVSEPVRRGGGSALVVEPTDD